MLYAVARRSGNQGEPRMSGTEKIVWEMSGKNKLSERKNARKKRSDPCYLKL